MGVCYLQVFHWHGSSFLSCMIAREVRLKAKRSSRRVTTVRSNSFRHTAEPQNHPVFGLPDSYQSWLSDNAAKEIGEFYRA